MENVYIKGISLHRYKTSSEWDNDDTIISQGEPIVYSDAFLIDNKIIAGMKIGNGKDIAKNLSFIGGNNSGESGTVDLTNIALIGQGNSTLISENVASFGQLNIVGQKGYKIIIPEGSTAYDSENQKTYPTLPQEWINGKYYILDSVDGLAIGDVFSIRLEAHSYNHGTITSIDPQTNKVVVEPFYNQTYVKNTPYLWILAKPEAGTQDIGIAAFAAGVENKSQGYNSVALGGYNKAYGWYSAAIGSGNEVGYGAVGFGEDNKVNGTSAVGGGDSNIINAYAAVGFGVRNEVTGPAGFVIGADNKVTARAAATLGNNLIAKAESQVVVGRYNQERSGSIFIAGTGESKIVDGKEKITLRNSLEVLSNGETRVYDSFVLRNKDNTKDIIRLKDETDKKSISILNDAGTADVLFLRRDGEGGKIWADTKIATPGLVEAGTIRTSGLVEAGEFTVAKNGTNLVSIKPSTYTVTNTSGTSTEITRGFIALGPQDGYDVGIYTGTDDYVANLFNESKDTIYGKINIPKGKIYSRLVQCSKISIDGNLLDGTKWTPNSNGY